MLYRYVIQVRYVRISLLFVTKNNMKLKGEI